MCVPAADPFDGGGFVGPEVREEPEQPGHIGDALTEEVLDVAVLPAELAFDRRGIAVGRVGESVEETERAALGLSVGGGVVAAEIGVVVRHPERPVGLAPHERVVVQRRPVLLDDARPRRGGKRLVGRLREELYHRSHVPLAVDPSGEDHQIEFPEEVDGQPLLDHAVHQRLDILGVCGADDPVACIKSIDISKRGTPLLYTMTGDDTQPAMTYPAVDQYEDWKADAAEMDMSVSEWIQAMVEAGRKKFDASVEPDETVRDLREQRNDLKAELEHARERIDKLENQLHQSERETIRRFVENNPGATRGEIGQRLVDTVPERLNPHLDALEGVELEKEGEAYYPAEGGV